MHVLVVAGGIGGLTAALALRESGFGAHVYEQARVLREVGAGLALGANAVRVLHRLGLADALRAVGVRSESWDFCDSQSGAVLGRVPLADAGKVRWGTPFYNVHGADLHDALRTAVGDQNITIGAPPQVRCSIFGASLRAPRRGATADPGGRRDPLASGH